jgi:hypothetical protein
VCADWTGAVDDNKQLSLDIADKSYYSALWSQPLLLHMAQGVPILFNPRTLHWSAQWLAIPYKGSTVMQDIISDGCT